MHNLYLYGPPGSGKTTLGKLLSERLGLAFLDLDRFIQNDAGMSVKAIFAAEGEPVIPACPGTNCEYDTARAFLNAGADAEVVLGVLVVSVLDEDFRRLRRFLALGSTKMSVAS